jgi:AraC family transcriptional regulator
MDWIKLLNDSISYIEENLTGEISYETAARIAGCSVYNYQRMFSYITDKSLSEYIRSRRLTLAAFDLLNSDQRIIDISQKYGYESQDAFSRAFRNFHGVLPSTVRNETVQLKSCPRLSFQITIKGVNHMNYQIEQWPAFKVMGVSYEMDTQRAPEIIPTVWENAWKEGIPGRLLENISDCRPAGLLGISDGDTTGHVDEMEYIIGVTSHVDVPDSKPVPVIEGMKEFSFPAAAWAVFEANGKLPEAIQDTFKKIYSEWFPNSGYKPAALPEIECYIQDSRQEIWIAVEKK